MSEGGARGRGGGQRYFTCKAEHGVYALYDEVQPLKFFQKAMGALGSLGSAMTRTSKSPERSDKVPAPRPCLPDTRQSRPPALLPLHMLHTSHTLEPGAAVPEEYNR